MQRSERILLHAKKEQMVVYWQVKATNLKRLLQQEAKLNQESGNRVFLFQ